MDRNQNLTLKINQFKSHEASTFYLNIKYRTKVAEKGEMEINKKA